MKNSYLILPLFFVLIALPANVFSQPDSSANIQSGKIIFQTNCSHCHGVHREILGPMLGSITKKKSKEWLKRFITDSQNVIASGDAYANYLADQYHHAVMPDFGDLSPAELDNLLAYLGHESVHPTEQIVVNNRDYEEYLEPTILRGRQLFENQCAACHSITREGYGPALGSVTKRHPEAWLISFIHNSQRIIKSGDPYAVDLFERFDKKVMVSMEFLTAQEIKDILNYIAFTSSSPSFMGGTNGLKKPAVLHAGVEQPVAQEDTSDAKSFFKILFIILATAAIIILMYLVIRFYRFLTVDAQR